MLDRNRHFSNFVPVRLAIWIPAAVLAWWAGCGNNEGSTTGPGNPAVDTIPPAAAELLMSSAPAPGAIRMFWLAVGDDGNSGRAHHYDLRYAASAGADSAARIPTQVGTEPKAPGERETAIVPGLEADRDYWFWLRVFDEAGNFSESAPAKGHSGTACETPAPATDFGVTDSCATALRVHWSFPEPGPRDVFELRISNLPITPETWNTARILESGPAETGPSGRSLLLGTLSPLTRVYLGLRSLRHCWSEISTLEARTTSLDAPGWHGMPARLSPFGDNVTVNSAAMYQERLYVAGQFLADSETGCCVAGLDPTGWRSLGDLAFVSPVLLASGDRLFVAGGNEVVAWDGSQLARIGRAAGDSASITGLVAFQGRLVAAGRFGSIDGVRAAGLAAWDGSAWTSIPGPNNLGVTAAAVFGDELVLAMRRDPEVENILFWNGSTWRGPIALNGKITRICGHDRSLYFLGSFRIPGGPSVRIATLQGYLLRPFDSGLPPGEVTGLAGLGTRLVATGGFPSGLAAWDGTAWILIETGVESGAVVHGVFPWEGHTLLLGSFTRIGFGAPVSGIAIWNPEAAWPI